MTPLIETVFGLVFVFLAFSLITSWVTEFLASLYQERGKMLRQFLSDALDDRFNQKNWGLLLYAHPLIESLGREVRRPRGAFAFLYNNRLGVKRRLPHYIPATQFATAFIENILAHNVASTFVKDAETGRQMLVPEAPAAAEDLFVQFSNAVESLQESEVKQTLSALIRQATTAAVPMDAVRAGLLTWYDSGMERVSGWYKRDTRTRLFWTGLVVAILFNVNTFDVVHSLWVNPQLRTAVAKAADAYVAQNPTLPTRDTVRNLDTLKARIAEVEGMLAPLQLPIGWPDARGGVPPKEAETKAWRRPTWSELWPALKSNWLGWLISAAALSFGAPFWFDALKRIANMRSAGAASRTVPTGGVPPTR